MQYFHAVFMIKKSFDKAFVSAVLPLFYGTFKNKAPVLVIFPISNCDEDEFALRGPLQDGQTLDHESCFGFRKIRARSHPLFAKIMEFVGFHTEGGPNKKIDGIGLWYRGHGRKESKPQSSGKSKRKRKHLRISGFAPTANISQFQFKKR